VGATSADATLPTSAASVATTGCVSVEVDVVVGCGAVAGFDSGGASAAADLGGSSVKPGVERNEKLDMGAPLEGANANNDDADALSDFDREKSGAVEGLTLDSAGLGFASAAAALPVSVGARASLHLEVVEVGAERARAGVPVASEKDQSVVAPTLKSPLDTVGAKNEGAFPNKNEVDSDVLAVAFSSLGCPEAALAAVSAIVALVSLGASVFAVLAVVSTNDVEVLGSLAPADTFGSPVVVVLVDVVDGFSKEADSLDFPSAIAEKLRPADPPANRPEFPSSGASVGAGFPDFGASEWPKPKLVVPNVGPPVPPPGVVGATKLDEKLLSFSTDERLAFGATFPTLNDAGVNENSAPTLCLDPAGLSGFESSWSLSSSLSPPSSASESSSLATLDLMLDVSNTSAIELKGLSPPTGAAAGAGFVTIGAGFDDTVGSGFATGVWTAERAGFVVASGFTIVGAGLPPAGSIPGVGFALVVVGCGFTASGVLKSNVDTASEPPNPKSILEGPADLLKSGRVAANDPRENVGISVLGVAAPVAKPKDSLSARPFFLLRRSCNRPSLRTSSSSSSSSSCCISGGGIGTVAALSVLVLAPAGAPILLGSATAVEVGAPVLAGAALLAGVVVEVGAADSRGTKHDEHDDTVSGFVVSQHKQFQPAVVLASSVFAPLGAVGAATLVPPNTKLPDVALGADGSPPVNDRSGPNEKLVVPIVVSVGVKPNVTGADAKAEEVAGTGVPVAAVAF
jgi:hypothetical protein